MSHVDWVVILPLTMMLAARHYRRFGRLLADLGIARGGVMSDEQIVNLCRFSTGRLVLHLFRSCGVAVALGFMAFQFWTLPETHPLGLWWMPGGEVSLTTIAFAWTSFCQGLIYGDLAGRLLCTVSALREAVNEFHGEVPIELGLPRSAVWRLFASHAWVVMPTVLGAALRWAWNLAGLGRAPGELDSVLSALAVPGVVLALVVLPLAVCGIPGRLASQRDAAVDRLRLAAVRLVLTTPPTEKATQQKPDGGPGGELEALEKQMADLKRHYPVWPVPAVRALVGSLLSAAPLATSALKELTLFLSRRG